MDRSGPPQSPVVDQVVSEVRNTVHSQRMLERVKRGLIAFSAGPDSVCLLDVLTRLYGTRIDFRLVYVNHGLRPSRAVEREEKMTRAYARSYGVDYDIVRIRVGKSRLGVESRARDLRYRALMKVMKRTGAERVILGHNLDDLVETYLINTIRGSGARGSQSIPAVRLPYVRPLINVKKADVLAYLQARRLKYAVDESNRDLKFRRNYIRHDIIPRLLEINPRLHEAVKKSVEFIKMDNDHIEAEAERIYPRIVTRSGKNLSLDTDKLIRYNKALSYRIVRKAVGELAGSLDGFESKHFALIFGLMSKENGKSIDLPKGLFGLRDFNRILIGKNKGKVTFHQRIKLEDKIQIRDGLAISSRLAVKFDLAGRAPGIEVFDRSLIFPPLVIRSPRAGDTIMTRIGKKRIKKYYNEHKISHEERNRLLVLEDRRGILWLLGYGRAQRARVGPKTRKFLVVKIEETDRSSNDPAQD